MAYTAEQLGAMLQCPASWFKERARRREIPFVMLGGKYRFTEQHVAEIVERFEQRPAEQAAPVARRRQPPQPLLEEAVSLQARRPRHRKTA